MNTDKPDAVELQQIDDIDALLREVVKDEILKDTRPTLETLKALHADRPLLVLALSQAIGSLTEREQLTAENDRLKKKVEAANEVIGHYARRTHLTSQGDECTIAKTYLAALEGEAQ